MVGKKIDSKMHRNSDVDDSGLIKKMSNNHLLVHPNVVCHYESSRDTLVWRGKERALGACERSQYGIKSPGMPGGQI